MIEHTNYEADEFPAEFLRDAGRGRVENTKSVESQYDPYPVWCKESRTYELRTYDYKKAFYVSEEHIDEDKGASILE